MKTYFLRLVVLGMVLVPGFAPETALALDKVATYTWRDFARSETLLGGEVDPDGTLKVIARPDEKVIRLAVLKEPVITKPFFVLSGKCRYENVGDVGFLEMWSVFGETRYFSRSLGTVGPTGRLSGSSDWREFALPMSLLDGSTFRSPGSIEVNIQLPEGGTVWLSDLTLWQGHSFELPKAAGIWWSDRTGGLIGGGIGAILGGLAWWAGWLASRPLRRPLAKAMFRMIRAASLVALVMGLTALGAAQPYGVWYPPLLVGVLGTVIPAWSLKRIRADELRDEMRKLEGLDAA